MKRFGVEKKDFEGEEIYLPFHRCPGKVGLKTARQYILNYYTDKPYDILFALE